MRTPSSFLRESLRSSLGHPQSVCPIREERDYVSTISVYSSVVLRTVGLGGQHHPGLHGSCHPGNELSLDEHTIELGTGSGRAHDRIDHQSEGGLEVLDPDLPEIPRSSEVLPRGVTGPYPGGVRTIIDTIIPGGQQDIPPNEAQHAPKRGCIPLQQRS